MSECTWRPTPGTKIGNACPECGHIDLVHYGVEACPVCMLVRAVLPPVPTTEERPVMPTPTCGHRPNPHINLRCDLPAGHEGDHSGRWEWPNIPAERNER